MQKEEKSISHEIVEKAKKLWEYKPTVVEEGRFYKNYQFLPDQKALISYPCYPCNDDEKLFLYFWDNPEQALNTKLLDKNSSFKIVWGYATQYRNTSLYKRGSILYKYSVGGKLSAGVEAYLIRPNPKNPQRPRLCKFLSFEAERHNKIPGITVKSLKPVIFSNLHPVFPFEIYDTMNATGGFDLVKRSYISQEEQKPYARVKEMLLALEQGKSVKSNDFASAISKLNLISLTLNSTVISEEMTKEMGTALEDEKRQKKILAKIDEAFNTKQDSKDSRTAKSFVPDTLETLVLKIYYLQFQLELDEDLACEILTTWFAQHPEDSKKIEQFVEGLYQIRFDQGRYDMHLLYSKVETAALCKKAVLDLQSGKAKDTSPKLQGVTAETEEKIKLRRKSSGDPSFLASPEMNLKQASAILKRMLIPYVGKDPGRWYTIIDENKETVFEIGVSKFTAKPALTYKNIQIQFEGEFSALTVLDKNQGYKVVTGPEADEQIIKIAKRLVAHNQSIQNQSSDCLLM